MKLMCRGYIVNEYELWQDAMDSSHNRVPTIRVIVPLFCPWSPKRLARQIWVARRKMRATLAERNLTPIYPKENRHT
jgi:hypothetical protein